MDWICSIVMRRQTLQRDIDCMSEFVHSSFPRCVAREIVTETDHHLKPDNAFLLLKKDQAYSYIFMRSSFATRLHAFRQRFCCRVEGAGFRCLQINSLRKGSSLSTSFQTMRRPRSMRAILILVPWRFRKTTWSCIFDSECTIIPSLCLQKTTNQ